MADKKVGRSLQGRPLTPSQRLQASLSDQGTLDVADPRHDKGKAVLLDKFKEREERWRREQAFHDREAAKEPEAEQRATQEQDVSGGAEGKGEGGAQ